ncbi:MAG: 50S ribosomal protein L21 [Paludibacteraceae bacterium]|nr:50S ribosomal protein L21 [Paludibacteraceae bacterium]
MYAIVEVQGQQFRVEADKKIFVHRMEQPKGTEVTLEKVLLVDSGKKVQVGTPLVAGASVVAEVVDDAVRGDKVLVFHKKRRKGYRKMQGHRQDFTELLIKEIKS